MNSIGSRIVGFIVMTFVIAAIYGLFLTTEDFMGPNYNPETSGHKAAENVYGLFGTVSEEIKKDDVNEPARAVSIAHKIAMPYAVTADLSALLGGKVEAGLSSFFHAADRHSDAS